MATNIVFGTILSLKLLLPFFDHVADSAEWNVELPFTESRVTKIISFRQNPLNTVFLDDRFRVYWSANQTNHYAGRLVQFTDWKDSTEALDPVTDLAPLTKVPSLIDERVALAIVQRFLKRLGYTTDELGVDPPEVRQMEFRDVDTGRIGKLPFFAVRCAPRFAPKGIDESLNLGIRMQVSGTTKRVVHFVQGFVRNEQVDLRTFAKPKSSPATTKEATPSTKDQQRFLNIKP